MKKRIAVLLIALMFVILCACGKTAEKENLPQSQDNSTDTVENAVPESETALGGWIRPESPEITDELASIFEKATEGLVGAQYTPVAYIAKQVVSGMNHAFLCRERIVVPNAVETYSIVTVYADTQGNVKILDVVDSGVETWISDSMGSWSQAESPVISDELAAQLEKAFEGMLGADYTPVAVLSTQLVAGMNYCVLCEQTIVYPGAEPEYVFVYMYVDLDGESQITDIVRCPADAADVQ